MVVQLKKFNVKSNWEQLGKEINFEEARKLLGLCYITFYAIFRSENIPHERQGRSIYFQKEDILDFMETHKIGDWSDVKLKDIEDEEKIDMEGACNIIGVCYDTFYSIMRRKQLPRFQYNTKIVFYKSLILKYKESCKRIEWRKEQI